MDEHRQHSCCKPDQHPQHHNREAPKLAAAGNPDVIYTCPMHPQIRQQGPGFCPICGMALEPLMPTEVKDDSEIRSVKRRFWISAALSVPVVLIAMLPHLLNLHLTLGAERAPVELIADAERGRRARAGRRVLEHLVRGHGRLEVGRRVQGALEAVDFFF